MAGAVKVTSDEGPRSSPGAWDLVGIGGLFVGCIVVGLSLGSAVDSWLDTSPVFVLVGIFLGIFSAIVGSWLRSKAFLQG